MDDPQARQLDQTCKGYRCGRFNRYPLQLRQEMHGAEGVFITDALENRPAPGLCPLEKQCIGATGIASCQDCDMSARRYHRLSRILALLPGLHHRRAAVCLDAGDARQALDQAHLVQLAEAFLDAERA